MKIIINYFFLVIFIFFSSNWSSADVVKKVSVSGNKKIPIETILEYAKFQIEKDYSLDDLNFLQKELFKTGFFKKISSNIKDNTLYINVVENPIINFFNIQFKDEESKDFENKIYDMLKLGQNKIFSEFVFNNDLDIIKEYFFSKGYSNVEVIPRISYLDEDKVNILININKNKQTNINRIYFIGDKKFSSSELRDVILSSEYGWWIFLSPSVIVNNERINYDKSLLKNYYLNNGYYDAQITSVEVKKVSENYGDIYFSINAGLLYSFGNFKIQGENLINDNVKNYVDTYKDKNFKKYYSLLKINDFLDKLNVYLFKQKIEFVDSRIVQNKNNDKIDLILNFSSTNRNTVHKINVTGNSITDETVVRDNLIFSEGDSYVNYKKVKSLDNLRSNGIFKKAEINTTERSNGEIDVNVSVTEQATGSISASAGYSTIGPMFGFGVQEANFLGKGVKLNTNLNIGTQRVDGRLGTVIPYFNNSNKTLFSDIYVTRTNYDNTLYQSNKKGFDISTRYEVFENIYFKPGYQMDFEKINVDSNASSFFRNLDGNYFTQSISYGFERDERDKKYLTTSGYTMGFNQQIATFGSDTPFVKNSIFASNYFPAFEKQSLNFKYGYTNIIELNNSNKLKLSDRLFVPHQYSKGFDPRGYGPKDLSSKNYVGGENAIYSLASLSLPNPLEEKMNLKTTLFINAFNVWGINESTIADSNTIRSAVGIGFDWRTPIGPLTTSFAKTISKASTDSEKFFTFDIGTVF